MTVISLECQREPAYSDALSRLTVAEEVNGYPMFLYPDETIIACKNFDDYGVYNDTTEDEYENAYGHFSMVAVECATRVEALRLIYPFYHEGNELPE